MLICSFDKTNEILNEKSQEHSWLRTRIFSNRRGKASVLNDLAQLAKNEILVFTDANTKFEKDALLKLVSKFSDAKIGGVCGRLDLEEPIANFDRTNREKLYWMYETHLKNLEGDLGILIAANGGIYAIRKELFIKFPVGEAITDDLYQTFGVLNQGYNFLYASDAIASEEVSQEIMMEFRRKVRFAATNFQTLKIFRGLLLQKKILISYALWSHKIIRWFVPLLLILLLLTI
ncbi:MAG: glycosyltransferase [Ignavibacteriaceae bacterium]|nr:glycosyltransferase [Ignavibacteriaceae bacterium]